MNKFLKTAVDLTAKNISVIPISSTTKKCPPKNFTWDIYQTTVMPIDQCVKHFEKAVGIAAVPSSFTQLQNMDFDDAKACPTENIYDQYIELLKAQHPDIYPKLAISQTPSGGHHFWFKCSKIDRNEVFAQRTKKDSADKHTIIIESRQEGGYALIPPSPGYEWVQGNLDAVQQITVDERQILHDLARIFDRRPARDKTKQRLTTLKGPTSQLAYDVQERFDDAEIRKLLAERGWTFSRADTNGEEFWTRPGKDVKDGHSATYMNGYFYVFTSDAAPLEINTNYTKFDLISMLKYSGDDKKAFAELQNEGFGKQPKLLKVVNYLKAHYSIRNNVVNTFLEFRKLDVEGDWERLEDDKANKLQYEMTQAFHDDVNVSYVWDGAQASATIYHPFKEYFNSLAPYAPDKEGDYLEDLLGTITLENNVTEEKKIIKDYLQKWLIGVTVGGCEEDTPQHMLILYQAAGGAGKTQWLRTLMPPMENRDEYFLSEGINPDDKDALMQMSKKLIINVDEMDSLTSKKSIESLKWLITLNATSKRAAYARKDKLYIRRASYCATTNNTHMLADDSGTRRFLVVPVTNVDQHHKVPMERLYAQMLYLKAQGEKFYYDKDEIANLNQRNEQFQRKSAEYEMVSEYFEKLEAGASLVDRREMSASQIEIFFRENCRTGNINKIAIGRACNQLGFDKKVRQGTTYYTVKQIKQPSNMYHDLNRYSVV